MKLRFLLELSHAFNYLIVSRDEWQARPPREQLVPLHTPVPYVVVHHSYIPGACYNRNQCSAAMREIQDMHMDESGWADIGFHFGIGSNGDVYEGCGWKSMGAHALHFNTVSLGLILIGDWRNDTPPLQQLYTLRAILSAGIELRYIRPDYKLISHHQVGKTDCPGKALHEAIRTWEHYSTFPSSYKDLINVREIPDFEKQLIANSTPVDDTTLLFDMYS